jgi:hypothetical protein
MINEPKKEKFKEEATGSTGMIRKSDNANNETKDEGRKFRFKS